MLTLFLLCNSGEVSCYSFFDFMSVKANEFVSKIKNAFEDLRNKVKIFIFPELEEDKFLERRSYDFNGKSNKVFCDFVEQEAANIDSDSSEYINLRSEPTALMSTPQLAAYHGKRFESHIVLTKDGYLLTIHRLRRPFIVNADERNEVLNDTILLHHGLLGSSADWILIGPEKSLPYILSKAGYDVWLANARGNYYSRGHISKRMDSLDYWQFSFQEIGQYDLPAVVDYIIALKNSTDKITFIGHSMGATAFLAMLSSLPNYNNNFRMAVFLAPLVYMTNTKGPFKIITTMAKHPPKHLLRLLGEGEFVPGRKIPNWIANKYCKGLDIYCQNPLLFLSSSIPEENLWDKSLMARVLYHIPAGGSTNTVLHFAQMAKSGKFHKYDNENDEFSLRHVKVPIVMFSSSGDLLATIPDVLRLYFSITNPIDNYVIREKQFTHIDFLVNSDVNTLVYEKVIAFLKGTVEYNISNFIENN
ncbi:unnamed protein product, partial [Brenthis ino]